MEAAATLICATSRISTVVNVERARRRHLREVGAAGLASSTSDVVGNSRWSPGGAAGALGRPAHQLLTQPLPWPARAPGATRRSLALLQFAYGLVAFQPATSHLRSALRIDQRTPGQQNRWDVQRPLVARSTTVQTATLSRTVPARSRPARPPRLSAQDHASRPTPLVVVERVPPDSGAHR